MGAKGGLLQFIEMFWGVKLKGSGLVVVSFDCHLSWTKEHSGL